MRSRTVREGSVGLLILLGLGLLSAMVLWLRNISVGSRSYNVIVGFPDAQGIQIGTPVRYRGVKVGRVVTINPQTNQVDVGVEITSPELVIPRNVIVQANQTGLINQAYIDIIPKQEVPASALNADPLSEDCPDTILCNNISISGVPGISVDRLMASFIDFTNLYADPKLFTNINLAAQNTALAAQEATKLTTQVSELVKVTKGELSNVSESVAEGIGTVATEMSSVSTTLNSEISSISTNLNQSTAQFSQAAVTSANSVTRAANQISNVTEEVNSLLSSNRSSLVSTLDNINQTTLKLSTTVDSLEPLISQFEQGDLLKNLEVLSTNAATASENLRDLSKTINDPSNLVLIQQTLDSARSTLQNIEKITSDVDDLTGDPQFRDNFRNLVNGLGNLLGSTQQLEKQAKVIKDLTALTENNPKTFSNPSQKSTFTDEFVFSKPDKHLKLNPFSKELSTSSEPAARD